jgi:murein DD-endopeptidase MepM/ murein hydrolase activator NlpD
MRLAGLLLVGLFLAACQAAEPVGLVTAPLEGEALMATAQHTDTPFPSYQSTSTRRPVSATPTATQTAPAGKTSIATAAPSSTPETPLPTPTTAFSICCPLQNFRLKDLSRVISNPYSSPPLGSDARHQGVDFVYHTWQGERHTIIGETVQAVLPGMAAAAIQDSFPYGNLVIIETSAEDLPDELIKLLGIQDGESLYHLYAHLRDTPLVALAQPVDLCQAVGVVGSSGNTHADHLHFETRIGPAGARFPVLSAFAEGTTAEERAQYDRWRISKQFRHFDPMILMGYLLSD